MKLQAPLTPRMPIAMALLSIMALANAPLRAEIPEDFPRYTIPGEEQLGDTLRGMYYLHYFPGAPMATMWDEWLPQAVLWPATSRRAELAGQWRAALASRGMESDGYVYSHQHISAAHQHGWPFPSSPQGRGWGQFFRIPSPLSPWESSKESPPDGWTVEGGAPPGLDAVAWNLDLASPAARLISPPLNFGTDNAPYIQIRWRASGLDAAQPYLEWATEEAPEFSPERRMFFDPAKESEGVVYRMVPVYRSPLWRGKITRLAIGFGNRAAAKVGVQSIFTQYDTRHTINNPAFIRGCAQYFNWTGDVGFLRDQIDRMRLALAWMDTELSGATEHVVVCRWPGHEGRTGLAFKDGKKSLLYGVGIGSNYWDLLPFGHKDLYATTRYYDVLGFMADLEEAIAAHPEWNIPAHPLAQNPAALRDRAVKVKARANEVFWQEPTGRFAGWVDADGAAHDYGFTFINTEAIYYGIASEAHAAKIMQWLSGERNVEGDTSQGGDIYHWRFGPRATTRRNVETYGWFWSGPETIPWGGQVQDGGGVFGFTHFDLMSRLAVRGPDDALARLREIAAWWRETQSEGGYREYYKKDPARGTMQGGGPPGGLGLDAEFFESILATQIMLEGFLGFKATPDGFSLDPKLPSAWTELTVTNIGWRGLTLRITARSKEGKLGLVVETTGGTPETAMVRMPVLVSVKGQPDRYLAANGPMAVKLQPGVSLVLPTGTIMQ